MPVFIPNHIQQLKPYRAGKPIAELRRERKLKKIIKLASNENPLGPSPKAMQAVRRALRECHRYPDPGAYELTTALAKKYGRRPQEIFCAAGIDSIIGSVITAFSQEGDEVLTSEGTFIGVYVNTTKLGRRLVAVKQRDYRFDLDAIARAVTPQTRIIILANPNNPTGTYFSRQEFEHFMDLVPDHILVLLDEAYFEYASHTARDYPNGLKFDFDNLVTARTFSKIYGLAGLRLGFACGPEDSIRELSKVKLPFEPSSVASAAGIAALKDKAFLRRTLELNSVSLTMMRKRFDEIQLPSVVGSVSNFLMIPLRDAAMVARFTESCLASGLIIRPLGSFGFDHAIRINSGTLAETRFALKIIEKIWQTI